MSSFWTPKPHFRGGRAYLKAFSQGTCGVLCALMLSSCGQSTPSGYAGSGESSVQSDTLQPLTVPPNSEGPPAPGTTGAAKTADGLPALHVKGVNTKLFSQRMSDEADRLDRLENAVQELRNDFDAMAPAIVRLVSIEGDIQALIKQLEVMNGDAGAAPPSEVPVLEESSLDEPIPAQRIGNPVSPMNIAPDDESSASLPPLSVPSAQEQTAAPSPPPDPDEEVAVPPVTVPPPASAGTTAPAQAAPSPAPAPRAGGVSVMDVRIGEHPDKVRIVLDLSGASAYTADLDNGEHILVIELDDAGWSAAATKNFGTLPVIASYSTEAMGNTGTRLVLQLKKSTSIKYKADVAAEGGAGRKIIIDLAK